MLRSCYVVAFSKHSRVVQHVSNQDPRDSVRRKRTAICRTAALEILVVE